jgi:hypothetical protein
MQAHPPTHTLACTRSQSGTIRGRYLTVIAGWMVVAVQNPITHKVVLIRLSAGESLFGPGDAFCSHLHQVFVPGGAGHCWRIVTTVE